MKKLYQLKNWFSLSDAAERLSAGLREPVTVNDVLQLTVEGHLALSWYAHGQMARRVVPFIEFCTDEIYPYEIYPEMRRSWTSELKRARGGRYISYCLKLPDGHHTEEYLHGPYRLETMHRNELADWVLRLIRSKSKKFLIQNTMGVSNVPHFCFSDQDGTVWDSLRLDTSRMNPQTMEERKAMHPSRTMIIPDYEDLIIQRQDIEAFENSIEAGTQGSDQESSVDSNSHPLELFRSMENLRFNEIKIIIDPENLKLIVSARGSTVRAPFHSLGLCKTNQISLNRQGNEFMSMANGSFNPSSQGAGNAMARLSNSLRDAFSSTDPPFHKYKPRFKLSVPKNKDAKQRAKRRTETYDDTKIGTEDKNLEKAADEFFKRNDPEYDPDDPTYSDDLN